MGEIIQFEQKMVSFNDNKRLAIDLNDAAGLDLVEV